MQYPHLRRRWVSPLIGLALGFSVALSGFWYWAAQSQVARSRWVSAYQQVRRSPAAAAESGAAMEDAWQSNEKAQRAAMLAGVGGLAIVCFFFLRWYREERSQAAPASTSVPTPSEDRYESLVDRLQGSMEERRQALARCLHDEVGQTFTAIKLDLAMLSRATADPMVQERVEETNELVDSGIQVVRRLSTELRPAILDQLGLVAALEWLAKDYKDRTGSACVTELPDTNPALSPERAIVLFRLAEEALANAEQHAEATEVLIELDSEGLTTEMRISDNGKGFSRDLLRGPRSVGLLGMERRAIQAGATCEWKTAPGSGTQVIVTIPAAIQKVAL